MTKSPEPANKLWQFIAEPLRRANEESRVYLASPASRGVDGKTVAVLLTAAFALTMQYYLCRADETRAAVGLLDQIGLTGRGRRGARPPRRADARRDRPLDLLGAGLFPQLHRPTSPADSRRLPRTLDRLRRQAARRLHRRMGLSRDAGRGWAARLGRVAQPTIPPALSLLPTAARRTVVAELLAVEFVYGLQFVGVEFFFRGFLVFGLKRRFGAYAIVVMMVPYCMIHFGKPLAETLASIIAGLALGFMSLRTRSIVLGVAIHMTVALSMDFASMGQKGWFG